ncbi:MAG: DUF2760 domain-containing protein [Planctomycetaceae bacterium]|nr:DUF2760 domain-containing protein [Planctomycetaceae bacterium]
MRIFTAFKAFFAVLFHGENAEKVISALKTSSPAVLPHEKTAEKIEKIEPSQQKSDQKTVQQSEAITLLAALQREARLIDFCQENLDSYEDVQVGAAARAVHDQCAAVLERFFHIVPLRKEPEQSIVEVTQFDAAVVQLTGNIQEKPPWRGQLTHHGWKAVKCELPAWNGTKESAMVLAPAEVEVP